MNALFWFRMLLGCVVVLVVPRLFTYLARLSDPFPEDVHLLARPLDWEQVKVTFDPNDAREEIVGCPRSVARRLLRCRFAAGHEYFQRMEHNTWLLELCAEADRRDSLKTKMLVAEDRKASLSDARGMLEGAELLEKDALLPEYASQADAFRAEASGLRLRAQELFALAEPTAEQRAHESRMLEALHAARRFRTAIQLQFLKVNFLSALLRLDKLNLLPADVVIALWHRRNDELLLLYQQVKIKATAYLSVYHQDQDFVAYM